MDDNFDSNLARKRVAVGRMFRDAGFEGVAVNSAPLPAHAISAILRHSPTHSTTDWSDFPYLVVSTTHGPVGVIARDSTCTLDLTGTGVAPTALEPHLAILEDAHWYEIRGVVAYETTLLRLRAALAEKRARIAEEKLAAITAETAKKKKVKARRH